ncbi:MAG: hypothetical protein UT58_C0011G0008 [Microgenomates group bacterium GW2011_GWC1_39_7b]|uniref:CBS domain-containing protein n=3 Tax=Candidatus Woeseibacteriota TaxID=1752722 RepID=A0A0G0PS20_9BACT|nr:MAG: hypothetical protein UT17_C0003G0154 [Candidatus Woesebacteria bacterium GW2011_GWB1_39_10]KKR26509.1 MAG: hypothetical protein UT58_C0011G0008 [Microgenomates group bacterium GW2011_GWC1_39_7b]KKR74317.1 MAG: hypothetical protein UU16_C0002G0008 [Candidatus Woesebacteria bacterium GW2011_GWA2_40_7]KKS91091.1 MAG: hypothetical protein UV66_C0001G0448 [Candidatus Woesebacteria bacterium GW2011_GWA1_43_12]
MSDKIVLQLFKEMGQREVHTISEDATALDAARMMRAKNIGALAVVNEKVDLVGIVSERDVNNKVAALNKLSVEVQVSEIMTKKVAVVFLTTNLKECEETMKDLHVRHLIVMDKGKLVGIVSIRDLLVSTREELEDIVRHLKHYIGIPG